MKRALAAFLCLLTLWTQAFAQTVTGPQTVNPPQVVSGADKTGALTGRQVSFTDLSFASIFGQPATSSTQAEVDFGSKTFILDSDPGFKTEYTVEITPAAELGPYMIGVISNIDTGSGQTVITVAVFKSFNGGIFTNWNIKVIGGPTIAIPAFISVGISTTSFTAPTTLGTSVSLTVDANKAYAQNTIVYIAGFGDNSSGFFADVISYNASTGAMVAFSVSNSSSGATLANWSVAIVTPSGPDAALIGYSSTSLTLGAGDFTWTTQAGQFFPIQGQMLASCLGTTNRMAFNVKAYNSTSLIGTVTSNGVYGSGTCAAWSLYLTTGPTTRISLYQINQLGMSFSGATSVLSIQAGSIRDSTDTIDLALGAPTTIDFSSTSNIPTVAQTGTITSAGNAVTGTGTSFLANFSSAATLSDFTSQYTAIGSPASLSGFLTRQSIISIGAATAATNAVTADTAITSSANLGAAGSAFTRGGKATASSGDLTYGVYLAYKTADGTVGVFATGYTPSGAPDLPSGYSYYRIIGVVKVTNGNINSYFQPLWSLVLTVSRVGVGALGVGILANDSAGLLIHQAIPIPTALGGTGTISAVFSTATNVLGADVNLSNVATYFDGPSMAQGTSGTWWVSGSVTVDDTAGAANINCKLWDGTTVISSGRVSTTSANGPSVVSLGGYLTSPAANIRISCNDATSVSGKIQFNQSGNSADANIWGVRINFLEHPVPANENDLIERAVA